MEEQLTDLDAWLQGHELLDDYGNDFAAADVRTLEDAKLLTTKNDVLFALPSLPPIAVLKVG